MSGMDDDFVCSNPPFDGLEAEDSPADSSNLLNGREVPRPFKALALPAAKKWQIGRQIKVTFLGDVSEALKEKVRDYADEWTQYAGLSFSFGNFDDADIRVKVGGDGGNYSAVGTDCARKPKDEPTMSLGGLKKETREERARRIILHEFGHALGCIHEHQSPAGNIQWNKDQVYADCKEKYHWDPPTVDSQIFKKFDDMDVDHTALDKDSIMMYPIPASWTTDGWSAPGCTNLSNTDKSWIRRVYPGQGVQIPPRQRLSGDEASNNYFNTMDVVDWHTGVRDASKFFQFDHTYIAKPLVALGLNWIDSSAGDNFRISMYIDDESRDGMRVHITTWADTFLSSAACNWFKCANDDPDFRVGSVESNGPLSKWISFDRAFGSTPKVIVWLNGLDESYQHNTRIRVYASDADKSGFRLHIETWSKTSINWAAVSWIAHSADLQGVASGTFQTNNTNWDDPPKSYSGTESIDRTTQVESARTVLLAFNMLDIDSDYGQRACVSGECREDYELKWKIEAWSNTNLNNAGVSYLLMGQ